MKELLYVFIGGGLGSVLRLLTSRFLNALYVFPFGTLLCNSIASFLVGMFTILIARKLPNADAILYFIIIGFCGGLSTFSTFSAESVRLFQNEMPLIALVNIGISIVLCLFCVWAGQKLAVTIYSF